MGVEIHKDWTAKVYIYGEEIDMNISEFNIESNGYYYTYNFSGHQANKMTEEKQVNKCEFELGDILVGKNEFDDETDGELILIAPGYKLEDFEVTRTPKGVRIEANRECDDCGEIETKEFFFEYNELFEVVDVKFNVRDGIFILLAIYDLGEEVELDSCL